MKFDTTPLSYSSVFFNLYGVWFWQTIVVAPFLGVNSFSAVHSGDVRWNRKMEGPQLKRAKDVYKFTFWLFKDYSLN
jgi:hypothetical protein